jgi:hypothetical protein
VQTPRDSLAEKVQAGGKPVFLRPWLRELLRLLGPVQDEADMGTNAHGGHGLNHTADHCQLRVVRPRS